MVSAPDEAGVTAKRASRCECLTLVRAVPSSPCNVHVSPLFPREWASKNEHEWVNVSLVPPVCPVH